MPLQLGQENYNPWCLQMICVYCKFIRSYDMEQGTPTLEHFEDCTHDKSSSGGGRSLSPSTI